MARAWHLTSRPTGLPTMDNFALRDMTLPPLEEGKVRVVNRWLSVDPYMRGRMNDTKSYLPPFQIDAPMQGGAIGEVVESHDAALPVGTLVSHMAGWRDEAVLSAREAQPLPAGTAIPPQAFLGNMGLTGMTAWFGLLAVAEAKAGETVFVSAAAGAVGSAVVQIARARGMTVIGSAGGADKCAIVRDLGADVAIDYKTPGSLTRKLAEAAPDGIHVYFDNVGGGHLDAAMVAARDHARFAICGMIGGYNATEPTALRYLARIIQARIRVEGFLVSDFFPRMAEFHQGMGALIAAGQITAHETVKDGLEAAPAAFLGLFSGGNTGKMLVRLPG